MFRLRTFGGLILERDGAPYSGPGTQRRRLALLALLAAADNAISRDRITSYLWPESDTERGRHSLGDALSALRREIGSDDLFLGVASLSLNHDVLGSDIAEHGAALRVGDTERAVALYSGPFLDGFFVPDAGEFERWVDVERSRRTQAHARCLDELAAGAVARRDVEAAIKWRQARVALDPLDTPSMLALLTALATAGKLSEALRMARVHETLVRQEFDTAPGAGWAIALDKLRADHERPPVEALVVVTPTHSDLGPPTVTTEAEPIREISRANVVAPAPRPRQLSVRLIAAAGVVLIAALAASAAFQRRPALDDAGGAVEAHAIAPRTSVAVLPFANSGGDVADEPFSDGLTDELITGLSKVPGVRVTAYTSAFALKGLGLTRRAIGDTLSVGSVIEGSFRRVGNRLHVSAQLVSVSDNAVLWAETYDRKLTDVFVVQAEIARAIANALRPALSGPADSVGRIQTHDLATYELYLKGRYFLGRRTPSDLRRAVDYFELAVARDSTYARAFAGLAEARALLVLIGNSPPREELPRARAAAAEAIRLDSTLAEAYVALGNIREAFDWDGRGADQALARAIALDPGYATPHLYHGIHLLDRGLFDDALAQLTQARILDPLSAPVHMQLGRAYVSARRPDEAIASLRAALELNPEFSAADVQLGDAYLQHGDPDAALAAFRRAAALNGGRDSAQIAYGLAVTGHRSEAKRLLDALTAAPRPRYLPPIPVAKAYVGLGEVDAAFQWLERAYEEHAAQLATVKVTPAFDALHADPRWARLLRRMGVEP